VEKAEALNPEDFDDDYGDFEDDVTTAWS